MTVAQINVDDKIARLESPFFPLVYQINNEFRKNKSKSLDIDLSFEYGEGTWDSCAAIWVGNEEEGAPVNRLLTDGKLAITVLTEKLYRRGYTKISHKYKENDLPWNVIRLSLTR